MPQTLTRRELYELVWSRPMTQLAQEFGLSDVGLKKICDRHRVPTPTRGYWAKKEAGKRVKQTIFVEVDEEHLNRIKISASGARLPEEVAAVLKRQRTEKVQTARKPRVEQPAATDPFAISDLHAAIRQTAKALRRPTKDAVSVRAFGDGLCGVEVGIASAERAIVILHGLAGRLELKGLPLTPAGDGIRLARGADEAKFHIREVTKTVPHTPTEAELAAEQQRLRRRELYWQDPDRWSPPSYQRAYPETDRLWTGRLFLEIEGYSDGVRRRWSDGKTQTVESLLDSIVDGFEVLLAARKIAREKREEWHRQWAELDRRRGLARERRKRSSPRRVQTSCAIR